MGSLKFLFLFLLFGVFLIGFSFSQPQRAYVLGTCNFHFHASEGFSFQGVDNDTVIFTVMNGTLDTTDSTVQIYASMGRVVFNSSSIATLNFTSLNPENLRLSVDGKSNFAQIGNSYIMSVPLAADMIIQWQFYPPDFLGDYFLLGEGLVGVGLMIFSPAWVTWEIKKHGVTQEAIERFGYAMLLFIVGFGLVIMYLWSA
jgi:hypothetical protein